MKAAIYTVMKIKKLLFPAIFLLSMSCTSDVNINYPDNSSNNCLQGQGTIVSENRVLDDFHSIASTIFADILITQGTKEDVIIEAQPNILSEIKTEVVNGELRLQLNRCVNIAQAMKVHITIPEIKSLTMTGVGDIVAQNEFDANELKIVLTGVGDFNLMGSTKTLDITLTGVGDIKAFGLNTDTCDVNITGVGDAELFVNDELNVTITGTGTIFYKGNPTVNSTITGSGSVVDAN
ncbi:MAG: DUF2807 domain-containing protein [Maribacter sp.]|nr:DUF2807 domain-containing protein [Maribacter sp.]